jgi:hypothetical protein
MPLLEVYLRFLILLLLFDLAFPWLISLFGVFPISLLPGIVVGLFSAHMHLPVEEQPAWPAAVPQRTDL